MARVLSRRPKQCDRVSQGFNDVAQASVYQAPSGAWVFAASTFQWSWLLSDVPFHGTSTDSRIQRTTQNVLDRFVQSRHRLHFPVGTMAVNVIGCFVLGLLGCLPFQRPSLQDLLGFGQERKTFLAQGNLVGHVQAFRQLVAVGLLGQHE